MAETVLQVPEQACVEMVQIIRWERIFDAPVTQVLIQSVESVKVCQFVLKYNPWKKSSQVVQIIPKERISERNVEQQCRRINA